MQSLSIIIPNYNHAEYLPEVIESCFNQAITPCEVIVIDDASTDNSLNILKKLSLQYKLLTIIKLKSNQGVANALNIGIDISKGDWLLFRAADDICPITSFKSFQKGLKINPNAALITGDVAYFDKDYQKATIEKLGISKQITEINNYNYLSSYGNNIIHGVSSFCRRSVLQKKRGFDSQLYWHCDWYLLMEIGLKEGFIYIPETLGYMRINPASYNAAGSACPEKQNEILIKLLKKIAQDPLFMEKLLEHGCLDFFGSNLINTLLKSTYELKNKFKRLLLVPNPSISEARSKSGHALVFRNFINKKLKIIEQNKNSIAFYGAGGHTKQLLDVWNEFSLPKPCLIIETKKNINNFMNILVKDIKDLNTNECKLIILSSKSYEPLLASMLETFHPDIPFLKIWGHNND